MERWEYEVFSYPIREVLEKAVKEAEVITCDPQGVCLHKDMPMVTREVFVKILNELGNMGWELVETHYNGESRELVCVVKRPKEFKQLQH